MDMTIDQQVALDEALVPHASRLRIGKSNFRLRSNITSKESTLQLVYDVLRLTPFYKAFLVTADVPEIYMQEFWATATVHHHSIRFKMDNKKRIVNLEYFREMMHICLRLPGQTFDDLPFEEEHLAFLRFLRHSREIKRLTDDAKKSNKMYYHRFTKVIIHYFMTNDPSIPRRNKVKWHYVKNDQMFTTIKLVSRHQNTQQFGAMLPIGLTNEDIKNSKAYKEYYEVATGVAPPKTKASVRKTKSSFDTTVTPPTTVIGKKLSTSAKGKQPAKASKAKSLTVLSEVAMTEAEQLKKTKDEERLDPIAKTPENSDDEGNDDENLGLNVGREEGQDEEDDEDKLYKVININLKGRVVQMADVHTTQELEDTHTLEANFSEFVQTNHFARAVSSILGIIQRYMDQWMNEAVKVAVQIQSDRLRDEAQAENEEFFKNLDENIQKIIKEQVKEQVKTSYAVAVDLSKMELKKILIEKMKGNKFIHRSDEQRNLYKALVEAYESDKIILDTYGDIVTLKRLMMMMRKKMKNPSLDQTRGPRGSKSQQKTASESAPAKEPMQTTQDLEEPSHQEFETGVAYDQPITEASQHPEWFQQQKKPPTPDRDWNNTLSATHESIQPDDENLYKFKESDFKRLRIQDIEDMLLLLVQGKLINLTVEECFAFNVSLRMFTRSIVIQRRVEDLQLGIESYQKKLNLTRPDTYRFDLKRKEAYTTYSNPRGFIYQNKDTQNRLMRIDELHKFNDGTC
uniref:Retrovirus-related Pol polyprotein from transposon TNT 1-94 n=1 Tax=Tanacetum cinerariifolium TaxID=118510 RepID=A0A6L2N8N5_TANCI|nr:hypothetical protein [Tanacetum cinerariifolium]